MLESESGVDLKSTNVYRSHSVLRLRHEGVAEKLSSGQVSQILQCCAYCLYHRRRTTRIYVKLLDGLKALQNLLVNQPAPPVPS